MVSNEVINDLADSVDILRVFDVKDRTGLRDLLPALLEIDKVLERGEPTHGGKWRKQPVDTHLMHALYHLQYACTEFNNAEEFHRHLNHGLTRMAMALTNYLASADIYIGSRPSDLRSL